MIDIKAEKEKKNALVSDIIIDSKLVLNCDTRFFHDFFGRALDFGAKYERVAIRILREAEGLQFKKYSMITGYFDSNTYVFNRQLCSDSYFLMCIKCFYCITY